MRSSSKKRILMLLENNPYPQDKRVRVEAETLSNAGYHVSVIAPAVSGQPLYEIVGTIHVFRYPTLLQLDKLFGYLWEYSYSFFATFVLTILVYFKQGFDVIHAHNPPDIFVFIALLFKLLRVRFVFDHHDLSPELFDFRFGKKKLPLINRILIWLEILSCRAADHVLTTNESYKAIEQNRAGISEEKITIVRNGPDLTRVRLQKPDCKLRENGKFILAYVGSIGVQDGVDYLLRSISHLIHDFDRQDFYTVIIGNGDALEELKDLTSELKLDQYVTFTGYLSGSQLFSYLSSADIGLEPAPSNPLNDQSTMIKVMEYMALGIPIVAFDLPENRYTAQSAAIFVTPNNESEFARAIVKLMDNEDLRSKMGSIGRERIETQLAWQYPASELLGAYRKILNHEKRTGTTYSDTSQSIKTDSLKGNIHE